MKMCGGACLTIYVQRSKDNVWEKALSFHHMGPGNQTQIARIGGKALYLMSHLATTIPSKCCKT